MEAEKMKKTYQNTIIVLHRQRRILEARADRVRLAIEEIEDLDRTDPTDSE